MFSDTKIPTIGLMSIGGEDVKGSDLTKEVFKMLKQSDLNFRGNIEGHDLFENPVEVVVCDGFVGNVILKTCESIADAIFKWLKHELTKSKMRMAGAYLARNAFLTIKRKTNYEEYGGMPSARSKRHLHHCARSEHATGDQERAARRCRIN